MKYALYIMVIALVLKDISHINDPYVMRGIAQLLCFVIGISWLLPNLNGRLINKYWTIFCYLLVLLISVLFTKNTYYVLFQVASLLGIIAFAISYFESLKIKNKTHTDFINITTHMYFIACLLSILIIPLLPNYAYEVLYAGEMRFRGLFSKSSMVAAAGGILFGFAIYAYKHRFVYVKYLFATAGLFCVLLTQSRTFWGALAIASILTLYFYYPKYKKYSVVMIVMVAIIGGFVMTLGLHVDTSSIEKVARVDSISSLSGRLELWESGINQLNGYRFFIGHGFTAGAEGVLDFSEQDSRDVGRTTLHNGYVQALLDSGLMGLIFYLLTIVLAIKRLIKEDTKKSYPHIFYILIFLGVANLGEAVIYTASVYHSIVFWFAAIFAMGLKYKAPISEEKIADPKDDNKYDTVKLRR